MKICLDKVCLNKALIYYFLFFQKAYFHEGRRGNDEYGKLYLNALWDPQHKFKIVSTGFNGELLLWDLTNPNRNEAVKVF